MSETNFDKCHSCNHFSGSTESCREGLDPCTCERELAESNPYKKYKKSLNNYTVFEDNSERLFVNKEMSMVYSSSAALESIYPHKLISQHILSDIYHTKLDKIDFSKKWIANLCSQKGCMMYCKFCKYPNVNFLGNVDLYELNHQLNTILRNVSIDDFGTQYYDNEGRFIPSTDELDIYFSIMGEPTFNNDILIFAEYNLRKIVNYYINAKRIHPVLTTNLPKDNSELIPFLLRWCNIKNKAYEGDADLQFNLHSTSNTQRNELFDERSLTIEEISKIAAVLPKPIGKKYILNFNYNSDTIIDINIINQLFDKNNWIIRIEKDVFSSEWDDSFLDILKLVNNCGWDIEIDWRS